MTIYVVYEEDRGLGVFLVQAFQNEDAAKALAETSSHYFYSEVDLEMDSDFVNPQ